MAAYGGLAPNRRQAMLWTHDGIVFFRIYASLGLNELIANKYADICTTWLTDL